MRIKLDENLPARLVPLLTSLGHEVDTVADEGLTGKPDADIWRETNREGRFLITQDLDFSDTRLFQLGTHPGILLVRLREPGANALMEHIGCVLRDYSLEDWSGCFIVLTEHKLRIKRPAGP